MLDSATVRVLGPADETEVTALLDRDPVTNVFVASRLRSTGLDPVRTGGEVWGFIEDGRLVSLCYSGANLVPVAASRAAVDGFAERALRQGRRCSSLVGPAGMVLPLWDLLRPHWGRAREVRGSQPLMTIGSPPAVAPDPAVRQVRPDEVDALLPASVAMFTEEVGVSPLGEDGGALYRARVAEIVREGRAYARFEDGEVLFKAEIGAATPLACQVQGVWVRPDRRGEGISVAGMAAVVRLARRHVAPVVTLYVNDYNQAARAAYRRVGFRETGTFASVLF
ncbi:MAG TPA: GNAT family N-acetyltransferase [Jiangellales bacterium]|nr:GNAT family N-acetyltransferase [Jiangellales bacterium]